MANTTRGKSKQKATTERKTAAIKPRKSSTTAPKGRKKNNKGAEVDVDLELSEELDGDMKEVEIEYVDESASRGYKLTTSDGPRTSHGSLSTALWTMRR